MRQGCDIDLDPQAGRRAQDEAAETKTGLAKMLQTNPDCSWDTFDGKCLLQLLLAPVYRCIRSTAARQLRAQQSAPVVADRVIEMSAACCDGNADVTCRDGSPPRDCGSVCAVFFHSFFNDCGVLLQTVMAAQIDEFTAFDATCLASADVEFFLSAIQHTTCKSRGENQCVYSVAGQ